jgi:hypothetical protein
MTAKPLLGADYSSFAALGLLADGGDTLRATANVAMAAARSSRGPECRH